MRVHVLPDHIVNKIAAGEVVERPSSVVRELVENALDAGARDILVELEQGGQSLIRVTDDGCGMEKGDALLALERHATSKIKDDKDLEQIATLGFRGEALPSIAAVSRMRLRSRTAEGASGNEVVISGGAISSVSPCAMPQGTSIEIRSLFFNVPARRKFLRSVRYEESRVKEWLGASALSKPQVRFRLIADGKEMLNLARRDSTIDRGYEMIRGTCVPFDVTQGQGAEKVLLSGLVAHPSGARGDAGGFHILVNGRVIHDRMILRAVREGYLHTLKDREYPVGFVALQLSPNQVDVNVHPQKSEVRFRDGRALFSLVRESVARAVSAFRGVVSASDTPERVGEEVDTTLPPYFEPSTVGASPTQLGIQLSESVVPTYSAESILPTVRRFSDLRYVGMVLDCYLLCQHGDDLVVVDMHAAHERCNYNRIRAIMIEGSMAQQRLLVPTPVDVGARGVERLQQEEGLLRCLGVEYRDKGEGQILVTAVPSDVRIDPEELIREVAATLVEESGKGAVQDQIDRLAARLACHASIRSGEDLTVEEVHALFADLDAAEMSGACPHGRPVVAAFSRAHVERWFGRDR